LAALAKQALRHDQQDNDNDDEHETVLDGRELICHEILHDAEPMPPRTMAVKAFTWMRPMNDGSSENLGTMSRAARPAIALPIAQTSM
jgi:hypothetical protein